MEREKIQENVSESPLVKRDVTGLNMHDLNEMLLSSASLDDDPLLENNPAIENAITALEAGADLNARIGPNGPNVLFLAASGNKIALFDWLLRVTKDGKKIDVDYKVYEDGSFLESLIKENVSSHMIKKFVETFNVDVNKKDFSGGTALMRALFSNNSRYVNLLLESGADPNQTFNKTNVAPVLFAASECFDDSLIPLVNAGADLTVVDSDGQNALMLALLRNPLTLPKSKRNGLLKLIDFLLDKPEVEVNINSSGGVQPLFHAMIFEEFSPFIKKILDKGADVNARYNSVLNDAKMSTPLIDAVKMGKYELVEELLNYGAKMSMEDSFGNSPESLLMVDRPDFFLSLVEKGVSFNPNATFGIADKENQFSATEIIKKTVLSVLLLSSKFSKSDENANVLETEKVISLLLQNGVSLTLKDNPQLHSSEPLFVAMQTDNIDFAKDIFNSKKLDYDFVFNIGDKYIKNEQNYLSYLISEADIHQAKELQNKYAQNLMDLKKDSLRRKKISTGIASEDNENDVVQDAKNKFLKEKEETLKNQVKFLDLLLENTTISVLSKPLNDKGENAIFKVKEPEWLSILSSKGFDILPSDNEGYSPLDRAIISNNKKMVSGYKNILSLPDNTLYKFAFLPLDDLNSTGQINAKLGIVSSLYSEEHYKEYNKNSDGYIFPHNKMVDYKDADGNTALLAAVASGNTLIAELVINMGADVNVKNNNDETPLQYACLNGLNSLAKRLIDAGADIYAKNAEGFTAIDLARESKLSDVILKMEQKISGKGKSLGM